MPPKAPVSYLQALSHASPPPHTHSVDAIAVLPPQEAPSASAHVSVAPCSWSLLLHFATEFPLLWEPEMLRRLDGTDRLLLRQVHPSLCAHVPPPTAPRFRVGALMCTVSLAKWARENGCPWSSRTCNYAARGGHLHVLEWARANGCAWDARTCAYAARGGHLHVLEWAYANGCPWHSRTCSEAAGGGHLHVLEWAVENGREVDWARCVLAAGQRVNFEQDDVLVQWLQKRCPARDAEDGHQLVIS